MVYKVDKKKLEKAVDAHKSYSVFFSVTAKRSDAARLDKIRDHLYAIESENSVLIEHPASAS